MSGSSRHARVFRVLALALILLPLLLAYVGQARERWLDVYDDAFISYRYARNLAEGEGLTWNPGEAPTEGYTNFLLVLILAPLIRMGVDPLLATRAMSLAAALGMVLLLYAEARRKQGSSRFAALLIGLMVLAAEQTRLLCMVGLETVIYAFALLATLMAGVQLLRRNTAGWALLFAVLGSLTFLFRPEVLLVFPVIILASLWNQLRSREYRILPALAATVLTALLLGAYLSWKMAHFGVLMPNPFFLKAGGGLLSGRGIWSVKHFLDRNAWVVALWALSFLLVGRSLMRDRREEGKEAFVPASAFALLTLVFFLSTDTLMDIEGRFLYPLLPVLIYANMPLLAGLLDRLEQGSTRWGMALLLPAVFFFAVDPSPGLELPAHLRYALHGNPAALEDRGLERREQLAGQALGRFDGIENIRIAFGDAGMIPYYSRALYLDVAGLNDGFIARERDREKLLDYFFGKAPELVLHPATKEHRWIPYGHGPLGNYESWCRDTRWDDYEYVGTLRTQGRFYDIHMLLRKGQPRYAELKRFLEEEVGDGRWRELPLPLGSYSPDSEARPRWIPPARHSAKDPNR